MLEVGRVVIQYFYFMWPSKSCVYSLSNYLRLLKFYQNKYMELTEKTFDFACYARYWFEEGDARTKTLILKSLGYNLTVLDKKIQFSSPKPFYLIRKTYDEIISKVSVVEPEERIGAVIKYSTIPDIKTTMSGRQDSNLRPLAPHASILAI